MVAPTYPSKRRRQQGTVRQNIKIFLSIFKKPLLAERARKTGDGPKGLCIS